MPTKLASFITPQRLRRQDYNEQKEACSIFFNVTLFVVFSMRPLTPMFTMMHGQKSISDFLTIALHSIRKPTPTEQAQIRKYNLCWRHDVGQTR